MGRYADDDDLADVADALRAEDADQDAEEETPTDPDAEGADTSDEGEEVGDQPADAEGDEAEDQEPEQAEDVYIVQLDGQDVEVPASELVKGYMRTADYTRKTQLLAGQRRQLEDANQLMLALERNPAATLAVLARHYEVSDVEPDEGPTPEQMRLMQLEQWRQTEVARQRELAVNRELERLHSNYGEFDEETLFAFAVERGVADLETALRALQFGREAATRRVEKRQMAAVAGGSGRNGHAKPKTDNIKIESFRDAYEAAKRELNSNGN
jgi:muconolactone delta-isomerase